MKNANPVSWRAGLQLIALGALIACARSTPGSEPSIPASPAGSATVARYTYQIVSTLPHDPRAFTQGLVFRNGALLESTGLNGQSTLREVEPATGRTIKMISLPQEYFGEGLAVLGDRAYQLTWQNGKAFVYDADTFRREKEFTYEGEGWGLTTDGQSLILSDGTARIRFLDPATFAVRRTIEVTHAGQPVSQLNELEFIKGEIFANVWQTDEVMRIDPATGVVRGVINFAGLLPATVPRTGANVLNGIAYDAANDRLFVTGKLWPNLYEVKLKAVP